MFFMTFQGKFVDRRSVLQIFIPPLIGWSLFLLFVLGIVLLEMKYTYHLF